LQRRFRVSQKAGVAFRAEFFNIFNHPNFASPINLVTSPLFGRSPAIEAVPSGRRGAQPLHLEDRRALAAPSSKHSLGILRRERLTRLRQADYAPARVLARAAVVNPGPDLARSGARRVLVRYRTLAGRDRDACAVCAAAVPRSFSSVRQRVRAVEGQWSADCSAVPMRPPEEA